MLDAIGEAAGKVWKSLDAGGAQSISRIQRETGLSQSLTYLALGWLAREGKIHFAQEGRVLQVSLAG